MGWGWWEMGTRNQQQHSTTAQGKLATAPQHNSSKPATQLTCSDEATTAPNSCATMYMRPRDTLVWPVTMVATVTAGLRWPPDTLAVAYAKVVEDGRARWLQGGVHQVGERWCVGAQAGWSGVATNKAAGVVLALQQGQGSHSTPVQPHAPSTASSTPLASAGQVGAPTAPP